MGQSPKAALKPGSAEIVSTGAAFPAIRRSAFWSARAHACRPLRPREGQEGVRGGTGLPFGLLRASQRLSPSNVLRHVGEPFGFLRASSLSRRLMSCRLSKRQPCAELLLISLRTASPRTGRLRHACSTHRLQACATFFYSPLPCWDVPRVVREGADSSTRGRVRSKIISVRGTEVGKVPSHAPCGLIQ